MAKKFLRRDWNRHAKLGKGVKKNQKWRKPTGRDNKMREKRKGYPAVVSVGYKKSESERIKPVVIRNVRGLERVGKNQRVIVGNVGKKKKIEIAKAAEKKGIQFHNLNVKKFLHRSAYQKTYPKGHKQSEGVKQNKSKKKVEKKKESKTKDKKGEKK